VARQAAQRIRNKLSLEWIREAGEQIQRTVLELPEVRAARAIGLYLALPREVATDRILEAARQRGQAIALPAWQKSEGVYGMARWEAGSALSQGHYGIQEPAEPGWLAMAEIDVMIVTCLAFDRNGWRLGHGGGHFDRLLAAHPGLKLCLAFECQKLVATPCEEHDVPVDVIVTERATYRAPGGLTYADPEAWKHK
jgi:5-formyltetrahydrofolate cyclo-ligase